MQQDKFFPNQPFPIKRKAHSVYEETLTTSKSNKQLNLYSIHYTDNFIHTGLDGKSTKQPLSSVLIPKDMFGNHKLAYFFELIEKACFGYP